MKTSILLTTKCFLLKGTFSATNLTSNCFAVSFHWLVIFMFLASGHFRIRISYHQVSHSFPHSSGKFCELLENSGKTGTILKKRKLSPELWKNFSALYSGANVLLIGTISP